jgi:hypothetical protein
MSIYCFPESLRASSDYGTSFVSFNFIKRALPENATVFLYLPPGFSLSDTASYGSVDLGVIGGRGVGFDSESGKNTGLTEGERKDIATFGLAKAADNFGAEALFAKEKIQQGIALNPNTTLQFNNINVREFSFSFKLVAESQAEAEQALLIENLFRAAAYPELKTNKGLFLEYPPTFDIKFHYGAGENKFMPVILESYLTGVQVTYNAGTNMYHADGSPTEIDLTLNFSETQAITREKLYANQTQTDNPDASIDQLKDNIARQLNDKSNRSFSVPNRVKSLFR